MKKIVAIVLVLAFCLCPLSALAEEERTIDIAEQMELTHLVFAANTREALLSRHESITFTFRHPFSSAYDTMIWETREAVFNLFSQDGCQYDRDGMYYQMNRSGDTGRMELYCGAVFDPDYDPFYSVFGEDENVYFDSEHDTLTGGYARDGYLHLFSAYDEVNSEKRITYLDAEYTGQILVTEVVVDENTYELAASIEYIREAGKDTLAWQCSLEYDTPEPVASRVLRAAFERDADRWANVTYVLDPGTDHEQSRTLTVPANTKTTFTVGSTPCLIFGDPDAAALAQWDGLSDMTWYVFTNPSDELINRYYELYYADMNETDPKEYSRQLMNALIAGSATKTILQAHSSFLCAAEGGQEGDYATYIEDGAFGIVSEWCMLADDQGVWYLLNVGAENEEAMFEFYAMSDEERADRLESLFRWSFLDEELTALEQLISMEDNGDGNIKLITGRDYDPSFDQDLPEAYQGLPREMEYILDGQTGELLSTTDRLVQGEERITLYGYTITYDAPRPAEVEKLMAMREKNANLDPADTQTITVIYDAGTEAEQRFSVQLGEEMELALALRDGYELLSQEEDVQTGALTFYAGPAGQGA